MYKSSSNDFFKLHVTKVFLKKYALNQNVTNKSFSRQLYAEK